MALLVPLLLITMQGYCQHPSIFKKAFTRQINSPDGKLQVNVVISDKITYDLQVDGKPILQPAELSFVTSQMLLTKHASPDWTVEKTLAHLINEVQRPVVPQKSALVNNHCNELLVLFKNDLLLAFRVYDKGIAWRWSTAKSTLYNTTYTVQSEKAELGLNHKDSVWYPLEDGFYSGNERFYHHWPMDSINTDKLASLPVLIEDRDIKLLLTESSLFDYAGMWVRGSDQGGLKGVFPHYPTQLKIDGDRDEHVESRADFIAKADGPRDFPWRILMVARKDKDILDNQMVFNLARPAKGDFSWVKPGKVQWDWWHLNNVYDVDFRAGINNDTYKYYIDFAAKNNIEYILLDEGWCDVRNLLRQSKDIDVAELVRYGKEKNVGVILWASWLTLDKQLDQALDSFATWGVKGIKVDFMQRDDQLMVDYYEKVAKAAAKRKILVDFHGAYKPTGLIRTYPNVMTSEGVLGNELSKFTDWITPGHTATLPYIRMAAGPIDFTPGGMRNVQKDAFKAVPSEPMTLGTRCNQMAMYVIYESPLQMLCDIPTHYIRSPKWMEFLRAVPTIWQKTVPLDGKVGQSVVMAREALNNDWYIGAMTNWTPRSIKVKLDFLPVGNFKMVVWQDGPNADRNAKDFQMKTTVVSKDSTISIHMAKGGGFVARLIKM